MSAVMQNPRIRITYLFAAALVIAIGLASRHIPGLFPQALGKYPGDALWTLMVFFGLGSLMPTSSSTRLALYSLAISFAVELSQLYQAPWINGIRSNRFGHLVLGASFGWVDFVAYSVGAVIGIEIERAMIALKRTVTQMNT